MAVAPFQWYPHGISRFFAGDIDWDAHTIKMALVTSSYTPAVTHDAWEDVTANEASGTGYTARGAALTTKTNGVHPDTDAGAWAATTVYSVGTIRRPTVANGHIYSCAVAGTSGGSEPSWPTTPLASVTDNTVTWVERGWAWVDLKSDVVTWTITDSITFRYAIIYRDTGTNATSYLIAYADYGGNQTASDGGAVTITPDAFGWQRQTAGLA